MNLMRLTIYLVSLESCDLILEALFLWIVDVFDARSARETAFSIAFLLLDFFADLIAISSLESMILFTISFLLDPLNALLAVFVTGMWVV